jgi:hypothetical protein
MGRVHQGEFRGADGGDGTTRMPGHARQTRLGVASSQNIPEEP